MWLKKPLMKFEDSNTAYYCDLSKDEIPSYIIDSIVEKHIDEFHYFDIVNIRMLMFDGVFLLRYDIYDYDYDSYSRDYYRINEII